MTTMRIAMNRRRRDRQKWRYSGDIGDPICMEMNIHVHIAEESLH